MSESRADRPVRKPLHVQKQLTAEKREGYQRRWVNDTHGRLAAFEAAGWTPVLKDSMYTGGVESAEASRVGSSVVKRIVNRRDGQEAVLMEIPLEYYNEDQAAKQKEVDGIEERLGREVKDPSKNRYGNVEIKN